MRTGGALSMSILADLGLTLLRISGSFVRQNPQVVDVQIVSGRDPAYAVEAIGRVRAQDPASNIFVAVNHRKGFPDLDLPVQFNDEPLTFEENHNRLAMLGTNPFILFLDDDAFIFEGALETMLHRIQANRSVASIGAMNNQTSPVAHESIPIPSRSDLGQFKQMEPRVSRVATTFATKWGGQFKPRLFLPGNCLLVRRRVWQKEYGGWDENYRNWNEEVDFHLWCAERGYATEASLGTWVFHCHGASRDPQGLLQNIVASAQQFRDKWPKERLARLAALRPDLRAEINALFELNIVNCDPEKVKAGPYFRSAIR